MQARLARIIWSFRQLRTLKIGYNSVRQRIGRKSRLEETNFQAKLADVGWLNFPKIVGMYSVYEKNQIFIILAARGIRQNQKRVTSGETSLHKVAPGQHKIFAVMVTVFDFVGLGIKRKVLSL